MLIKQKLESRKKLILYLDQNFLSDIEKAASESKDDIRLKKFEDLGKLITKLVKEEKVICPISSYHSQESPIKFRKPILDQAFNFSWDLHFRTELDLRLHQIADSCVDFFGVRNLVPPSEWWEISFGVNPDLPNSSRGRGNIFIHVRRDIKLLDEIHKENKDGYLGWVTKIQERVRSEGLTFERCKKEEIDSWGKATFVNPVKEIHELKIKDLPPTFNQTCGYLNALDAISIFYRLKIACNSNKTINKFLSSNEIKDIPLAKIQGTLFAAILTGHVDYNNKPSSQMDININSMVLPYVDIFCTDSANKELIKQLKLDKEYNVELYSMKDIDLLINRLSSLHSVTSLVGGD